MPTPPDTAWPLFWAKTNRHARDGLPTRPLWAHLLDVAHAAEVLWERRLPSVYRAQLVDALGLSPGETRRLLSLWIGLHDVGKAIPSFQTLHKHSRERLREEAQLPIADAYDAGQRMHHGHATIALLRLWLQERDFPSTTRTLLEAMAAFVGFHHGRLCKQVDWEDAADDGRLGDGWRPAQLALIDVVIAAWEIPDFSRLKASEPYPAWLLPFAGWATMADWAGSMADYYDAVADEETPQSYLAKSRRYAEEAVEHEGLAHRAALHAPGFLAVFGDAASGFTKPHPIQTYLAEEVEITGHEATLTIVEAPTGEGKTEAALYLAARQQAQADDPAGFYVAMPTQATSNEAFRRVRDDFLLPKCSNGKPVNEGAHASAEAPLAHLRLVHGNDLLHPLFEKMLRKPEDLAALYEQDEASSGEGEVAAIDWSLPRRAALTAPYGVGTVDQAFLSVLYAKHFSLRLFGLAAKTVIFDEVHAYDTYMSEEFVQLLQWLRAQGTHVILLSATLPETMRHRLLQAWGVPDPPRLGASAPYPAVWHTNGHSCDPVAVESGQKPKPLRPAWHTLDSKAVVGTIHAAVKEEACVIVVCNTVARAQELYRMLRETLPLSKDDLILFHARFPEALRQQLEKRVRIRFGKQRPNRRAAVLVATQVAEQSLDLDADVMLSDLAPVDLLLQRAGRLHRHQRNRPPAHRQPVLHILCPEVSADGLPSVKPIGGGTDDRAVYDSITLWKTWLKLQEREQWSFPQDYRELIEAVYGTQGMQVPEAAHERWTLARRALDDLDVKARREARRRLIPKPERLVRMVQRGNPTLAEEDDEAAHDDYIAKTRLGRPSVQALCLHRKRNRLYLDAACTAASPFQPSDPPRRLSAGEIKALLSTAVRLSADYVEAEPSAAWTAFVDKKMNPSLRHYRLLDFTDGWWRRGPRIIRYDEVLGLEIINRKRTNE